MPKIAGDPLTKVTLNLYTSDVKWLKGRYKDYSVEVRNIVNLEVRHQRNAEETYEAEQYR